jgi:hypothetical protein
MKYPPLGRWCSQLSKKKTSEAISSAAAASSSIRTQQLHSSIIKSNPWKSSFESFHVPIFFFLPSAAALEELDHSGSYLGVVSGSAASALALCV